MKKNKLQKQEKDVRQRQIEERKQRYYERNKLYRANREIKEERNCTRQQKEVGKNEI